MSEAAIDTGGPEPLTDLFGPAPAGDPLSAYRPPNPAADIFAAAAPDIAVKWRRFAAGLSEQAQGDLPAFQAWLDNHVQDLGLAFRLTGDEHERAWPLNPMPIFIDAGEWAGIEAGLVQRAELLEAVIADIYGPQKLVADGHLPAAVVSGSAHFARRMVGMRPPGGQFLSVYAVDLARGASGEWRVLADRARFPVGIGYALENRIAITRAMGSLLAQLGTRRQSLFFDALRQGIAARCERTDPRIGLLTPGRFNQSYPEQANLAQHLGFSLVEGRDLTVREGKLFVRTIAGLKRIDALWRWIGARDIDPLNFDSRSRIGVPNLIGAAAQGLVLANWPGTGVVESRAMPAFLPRLSETILGEPLKLPNAATWWCGSEKERAHVLANLDRLMIGSAFHKGVEGLQDGRPRAGSGLSAKERAAIEQGLARRPMDYIAQEIVTLSTTPALAAGRFEPRGFTLRAYLARDESGAWTVLPGGFARISERDDSQTSLMGLGDISTDVCIVDAAPLGQAAVQAEVGPPVVRRGQGLLPSQAADNLFWIGRYGERAHQTVRIVRTLIEQVVLTGERAQAASAVTRLAGLLRRLGAAPPGSTKWLPSQLAATALSDVAMPGSVRSLTNQGRQIALLLRDRLGRDSWRALQRGMPGYLPDDLESMSAACDRLVDRFATLGQLLSDGMSRGPAWHFLDMGICLERAAMILQAAHALAPGVASAEDLSALLDLAEGQSHYRSRYLAAPYIAPVFDMVLLDPAQPRGLAFQLARIEEHLADLPVPGNDGMPEPPLRLARQLRAKVDGLDAWTIDGAAMTGLLADLGVLSNEIGSRYFLQDENPLSSSGASFLA